MDQTNPQRTPLLLSVPEAADMLGVSKTQVYRLMRDGHLRTVRLGGRRLVPIEALTEMIDTLSRGAA